MSVATKSGDAGVTGLMFNRRVPKHHPRIEAVGSVDELNTAIGMARAQIGRQQVSERLQAIQEDLVILMGELATLPEDLERYEKASFTSVTPAMTAKLDQWIEEIEAGNITFTGWATPGASVASAAAEQARTICRRSERRVCAVFENEVVSNPEILVYLNRLADTLWLLARWIDAEAEKEEIQNSKSRT